MRIHRVLVAPPLASGDVAVLGDEAHHLARVLRVQPGDPVEAFDGEGHVASGVVADVDGPRVRLRLEAPRRSEVEADRDVTLAVGLLKGDKLSDVVRAGTELGVAAFVLVSSEHADRTGLSRSRRARLERVAREATKQCGRARVPDVRGPVSFAVALGEARGSGVAVVAHPDPDAAPLAEAVGGDEAITVFTGPEGGFAPNEVEQARVAGAHIGSLGPRILRAETAPIAVAALALARP